MNRPAHEQHTAKMARLRLDYERWIASMFGCPSLRDRAMQMITFDEWLVSSFDRGLAAGRGSVLESGDGRRCAGSDPSTVQRNATRRPSRVPNNLREMVEG